MAGVTTFQSGQKLTLVDTNVISAFEPGETDRVQLAPNCDNSNVETSGKVTSKINNYVNAACFTLPPIVGSDGLATGFGNRVMTPILRMRVKSAGRPSDTMRIAWEYARASTYSALSSSEVRVADHGLVIV